MFGAQVSFGTILIAAAVSFVVGFLWHGPLFGKTWIKLNNMSQKDIEAAKKKSMAMPMILNFIGNIAIAYVASTFLNALGLMGDVSGTIKFAFLAWLGFIAVTTLLADSLWGGKKWGLFVLSGLYWLVNLVVVSLIISLI